ncbi:MAG: BrnA antitoxin family protein [Comamonadaceae bacterium]|nr:BrnA antitoxin family protein [Comamonadaceae bacterium]
MQAEYDFSTARRAKDVPHLRRLQQKAASQAQGKQRITIMIDADVLEAFRQKAAASASGYQTLINEALRHAIDPASAPLTLAQLNHALNDALDKRLGKPA